MVMRFFRASSNLSALLTFLVVGGTLISGLAAFDAYRDVVGQTRRVATNLTLTVERDIGRDLHLVDTSIEGIILALRLPRIASVDNEIRQSALFSAAMDQDEFGAFVVLDHDGLAANISRRLALPTINFSDQEYSHHHLGS